MKNIPTNKKLYDQVVKEAKKKFMVWPSAYASGWVVRTYKKRGGLYQTLDHLSSDNDTYPLKRWYDENWINVCDYLKDGKKVSCGRRHATMDDYPYCRPEKRISKQTPTTLYELLKRQGISELHQRCEIKKENPLQKINRGYKN